ncbi:hypothetical protein OKW21_005025 [Catalinimonas alkaloidigena]|uniref:hypothetical protein n=1 Tax=Catalinimonas alkaloidigena TaxID=1075417 RepID=UPI0024054544|nr:hypothetical protein [Catalinimonas alkaloidigena]MDF9799762.1 hypothetical protein [Catalinimonas alkaloidigena]
MARYRQKLTSGKIIMYAAGAGAILGTGYVGYNFLRDLNFGSGKTSEDFPNGSGSTAPNGNSGVVGPNATSSLPKPTYHDAFPLEVGDRNWYVQQMQLALINHGGKAKDLIEQSGGADGAFGQGTLDALVDARYIGVLDQYLGARVTDVTYERILNKGSLSGLSGLGYAPKVAITTQQTFMINADSINQADPQAYPVQQSILLGYLMDESKGLSKIQTEQGDIFYTVSSGIKVI